MSKLPPSPTRDDDDDDVSDDESVDLLAPTQDVDAMTSCDGPMSPDLLADTEEILVAAEAIDLMTPVKDNNQHHLHSFINPLSVRTHSLSVRHATSPVPNSFLDNLRSEDVDPGDAVVVDNGVAAVNMCDDDELHWSESDCAEDANVDFMDDHLGSSEGASASEGTIIPGTAYDIISAAARREALRRDIPVSSVAGIPDHYEQWIRLALWDDWEIRSPHEWQIRAIHDICTSTDSSTYLIAKTGSGKSAVPLAVGSLFTGVTLTMVPLVGLGSDQVNKCCNDDNFIEGYHLDEHRGRDAQLLKKRLLSLNEEEANYVSVFLYVSPQSLQVGSPWYRTLATLASNNMIRLMVVDEAHTVAQDGREFRPEFKTAVAALRSIHKMLPSPCNFVAMSATFRQSDQDEISMRILTKKCVSITDGFVNNERSV